MKNLSSALLFMTCMSASTLLYANDENFINIKPICDELGDVDKRKIITDDLRLQLSSADLKKLCDEFKEDSSDDVSLKGISMDIQGESRKWRLTFTFGPFYAIHKKMDLHLSNADTDLTIKGIQPIQKHGLHHYKMFGEETGIGKFFDEPQNRITVELNNGNVFMGFDYSHPKVLFQDQFDTPDNNSSVDIEGMIAGEMVNEQGVALRDYIYQIRASQGNVNLNLFAGKIFKLIGKRGVNNLELHIGGGAGVSLANGISKYYYKDENGVRKLDITERAGLKVYGYNLDGKLRVRYNFLGGRMNASLNYDALYTRLNGPLGGWDLKGDLYSQQFGISIGASLDNVFRKNKKKSQKKYVDIE